MDRGESSTGADTKWSFYGGCVALLVAGRRPDLVKGLVLVDPVILMPNVYRNFHLIPFSRALSVGRSKLVCQARRRRVEFSSLDEVRASYAGRGAFATWRDPFLDDYLLDAFDRTDDNPPDSEDQTWSLLCAPKTEAATFAAQRNRPWGALKKVRKAGIPLTILRPEAGAVMTDKVAYRVLRHYKETVFKTIRGTTHFLPMEAPYAIRDELSSFISRLIEGFGEADEGRVRRSLMYPEKG